MSGLGSNIHTIGMGLAWAMDSGRVLLYHPDARWLYASEEHCVPDTMNPGCYFVPLSRCQYMARQLLEEGMVAYSRENYEWLTAKTIYVNEFFDLWGIVPAVVPNISDWHAKRGQENILERISWWRAVSARFLVRPKQILHDFTQSYFADNMQRYPAVDGWSPSKDRPPEDAICMHVRHGDKIVEHECVKMTIGGGATNGHKTTQFMIFRHTRIYVRTYTYRVYPMATYMDAAASILSENPDLSRNIFLTFDNETLVNEMRRGTYDQYNITFYYAT